MKIIRNHWMLNGCALNVTMPNIISDSGMLSKFMAEIYRAGR